MAVLADVSDKRCVAFGWAAPRVAIQSKRLSLLLMSRNEDWHS